MKPIIALVVLSLGLVVGGDRSAYAWDDNTISSSLVEQGFAISPIPKDQLNLTGNSTAAIGLGSYLVNAVGDCSRCHSFPQYLRKGGPGSNPDAGDPYEGMPSTQSIEGQLVANFNVSHYLSGGQCFGPYMARNLTPDKNYGGPVEGLTEQEFIAVMRTSEDIHCEKFSNDPICAVGPPTPLLQVMPWPTYEGGGTHLPVVDEALRAVPCKEPPSRLNFGMGALGFSQP